MSYIASNFRPEDLGLNLTSSLLHNLFTLKAEITRGLSWKCKGVTEFLCTSNDLHASILAVSGCCTLTEKMMTKMMASLARYPSQDPSMAEYHKSLSWQR